MALSKADGFLGDVLPHTARFRQEHAKWFDLAQAVNRLAMRVLLAMKARQDDRGQMTAAVLYGRVLTSYQAVWILAERGMMADARTVMRAAAETAVLFGAVVADSEKTCELLIDREFWHFVKIRQAMLDVPEARAEMDAQEIVKLQAAIDEAKRERPKLPQRDPINIADMARLAGTPFGGVYNVVYRKASGDSAHTSLTALNRHVRSDASNAVRGLRFEPDAAQLPETFFDAIGVLGPAIVAAINFFGLPEDLTTEMSGYVAQWKALTGDANG